MKYILYIFGGIVGLLILLCVIYFILLVKLKNLNIKLHKKVEDTNLSDDKNVLIIYQPSRHKTTVKIKDLVKEYIVNHKYGYKIITLDESDEDYSKYNSVIFIVPVYFGEVHIEILKKLKNKKFKKLLIIYNGLSDKNNEDELVKKISISKYSKIKLHTKDIEDVIEFLQKEGL